MLIWRIKGSQSPIVAVSGVHVYSGIARQVACFGGSCRESKQAGSEE